MSYSYGQDYVVKTNDCLAIIHDRRERQACSQSASRYGILSAEEPWPSASFLQIIELLF